MHVDHNALHSLYISKGFERMAASSSNASPVRRKNTATAGDITHILKAGLPEGLSAGVVIESSIEATAVILTRWNSRQSMNGVFRMKC